MELSVQANPRASERVSDFPVTAGCSEFEFSETGCKFSTLCVVWPCREGEVSLIKDCAGPRDMCQRLRVSCVCCIV